MGKRHLRWTQIYGNSRQIFPLKIIFGFGQIAQKWGEVARVRKRRLRNCHSIRLSQFHVGISSGLMFSLYVCLSVFLFLHSSSLSPSSSLLCPARMEESHFNSSPYFWPAVPTVSGQVRSLSSNLLCWSCFLLEVHAQ